MLYFNRNGVWFTVPIKKDAVYNRDLLERQIHNSLIALQNLKDRSPFLDQMRFEKKDQYLIKSVFGRDDILIPPGAIGALVKKIRELETILTFPIPLIKVFDGSSVHVAWDISKDFAVTVCPYIMRYNKKSSDPVRIVLPIEKDQSSRSLFLINELELVSDDKIHQGVYYSENWITNGYYPMFMGEYPIWWSCGLYCGGGPYSGCAPSDTGVSGAYHEIHGSDRVVSYELADFEGRCADLAEIAYWFNHYSLCEPSGIKRTTLGDGRVNGGNSWTSEDPYIHLDIYQWSIYNQWFYFSSTGEKIREFNEGDSCHYYCWGNKMDPENSISYQSRNTQTSITYPEIIDGAVWLGRRKFVYLWYNCPEHPGTYASEETAGDMSLFMKRGTSSAWYPSDLWDTTLSVFWVTTDDGTDHEITRLIGSNFDTLGETAIFKYGENPVYMFSLWIIDFASSSDNQFVYYGFIYSGNLHMIKFEATDYGEHLFESAVYISPIGVEKNIQFSEKYQGKIGLMEFVAAGFMEIANEVVEEQG